MAPAAPSTRRINAPRWQLRPSAEPAEGLRHLAADRAAADDQQLGHGLAQVEQRFIGEIRDLVDSGDRRHHWPRAGGDVETPAGEPAAADLERVRRDEPARAEDHIHAEAAESFRAVVGRDARDHRGDAFHHSCEVGLRIDAVHCPAVRAAHLVRDARRLEKRLRRHAAVPQAVAAEPVRFDQRNLGAQRCAAGRHHQSAGAAADHDDVELRCGQQVLRGFSAILGDEQVRIVTEVGIGGVASPRPPCS